MEKYFAHSIEGKPLSEWHLLEDHLKATTQLARDFAINNLFHLRRDAPCGRGDEPEVVKHYLTTRKCFPLV